MTFGTSLRHYLPTCSDISSAYTDPHVTFCFSTSAIEHTAVCYTWLVAKANSQDGLGGKIMSHVPGDADIVFPSFFELFPFQFLSFIISVPGLLLSGSLARCIKPSTISCLPWHGTWLSKWSVLHTYLRCSTCSIYMKMVSQKKWVLTYRCSQLQWDFTGHVAVISKFISSESVGETAVRGDLL